jgi:hypothetical protein
MPFLVATVDQSKSTAWSESTPIRQESLLLDDLEDESSSVSLDISPALFTHLVIDLSQSYPTRQITGFQLGTFIAQRVAHYNSAKDAQAFGQALITNGCIAKLGGEEGVGAVLEVNSQNKEKKAVLRFKVKTNSWYIIIFSLHRIKLADAMAQKVIRDAEKNSSLVETLQQDRITIGKILDVFKMRIKSPETFKHKQKVGQHSFTIKHTLKKGQSPKCHYCRESLSLSIIVSRSIY